MLVLFETPAGYSLFKVADAKKLAKTEPDDIFDTFFADEKKASKSIQLVSFQPFEDTADAVTAATSPIEGKVSKTLKSFLKKKLKKSAESALAVADKTMAVSLKESSVTEKGDLKIVSDKKSHEIFRGIRCYMDQLLGSGADGSEGGISPDDMKAMQLGLSHSLSRYKLKFSADKVDTMVIQAVGLLDELDKEINTYAMRVKEWYGWHFPELQALVPDNASYSQLVLACGMRTSFKDQDLSSILEDEAQEGAVKEAAEISMGTEIADLDILNISSLAKQVLSLTEYRSQLFEYLKNRMNAIAPNLTILVGELVGARLISHAGSLMNLAKQPASTVQILGAEKALFRALKTKHDTPKYGLIYHASLIGQAAPKHKGKISRVLAAKAALAIRVDALSDETAVADTTIGFEGRAKVEARLRQLDGGTFVTSTLSAQKTAKYDAVAAKSAASGTSYNAASDIAMDIETPKKDKKEKKDKKRSRESMESKATEDGDKSAKKSKKSKKDRVEDAVNGDDEDKKSAKKAKKEKKEKRKSQE
ncbi:nucleolar protein 58 [Fistulifera solaris]|uniref:Nucleolar protein 58 n=1 Tax=Fistulifera solaris TaxID=1519565 RepID=A0A1Z5JA89_FISSO|nr:nucleolar protein 58 [Fistulifera solaris]|eukprot:GAX10738.1 nucleolar protein 58 [Fistulifera solaris]